MTLPVDSATVAESVSDNDSECDAERPAGAGPDWTSPVGMVLRIFGVGNLDGEGGQGLKGMINKEIHHQWATHTDVWSCVGCQSCTLQGQQDLW